MDQQQMEMQQQMEDGMDMEGMDEMGQNDQE